MNLIDAPNERLIALPDELHETRQPVEMDWLAWIHSRLVLKNKDAELVYFTPNRIQARLLGFIFWLWSKGIAARLNILKPRQVGISTDIQLLYLAVCQNLPNVHAFVSAHSDKSTVKIFRKARLAEAYLPIDEKRPKDYSNRYEILWSAPHNSQFSVQTAVPDLDRGGTNQLIHASEVAFWDEQQESMRALTETFPQRARALCAFLRESTANGEGDLWHDVWVRSEENRQRHPDDLNCWLPYFISWLEAEEYSMPVSDDYDFGILDDDERSLRERGATWEQLRWRRWKIDNDMNGDPEAFKEEYPATPDEAFRASGGRAIKVSITDRHEGQVRESMRCRLVWDAEAPNMVSRVTGDWPTDYWQVWLTPDNGHDFAVAGDIAEGKPADPKADNDLIQRDRHAAAVLDRVDVATAAQFISERMTTDEIGEELVKAGYYYNLAWLTPETNSVGVAALNVCRKHFIPVLPPTDPQRGFRCYPRIYQRQKLPDGMDYKDSPYFGWKTTAADRDWLIDLFIKYCRRDEFNGWTGKLVCYSRELWREECTFVHKKTGKREHRASCHDDVLFAWMIAVMIHETMPRTIVLGPAPPELATKGHEWADGYDTEWQRIMETERC